MTLGGRMGEGTEGLRISGYSDEGEGIESRLPQGRSERETTGGKGGAARGVGNTHSSEMRVVSGRILSLS